MQGNRRVLEAYESGNHVYLVNAVLKSETHPVQLLRELSHQTDREHAERLMDAFEYASLVTMQDRMVTSFVPMPKHSVGVEICALDVTPDWAKIKATKPTEQEIMEIQVLSPWGLMKKNVPVIIETTEYDSESQQVFAVYGIDELEHRRHLMDFLNVEEAIATAIAIFDRNAERGKSWRHQEENHYLFVDRTGYSDKMKWIPTTGVMFASMIPTSWRK